MIDNFDSFTYNLQDYLRREGHFVKTIRYDALDLEKLRNEQIEGIVISPGPGVPNDYPKHFDIYKLFLGVVPLLGVCLGHQSLGCYFGATLAKAIKPMHGKVSEIQHSKTGLFKGISSPTVVTRYHSLIIKDIPECIYATAFTSDKEIMAFSHKSLNVTAVQFHPEAHLTEFGQQMVINWLQEVKKTKETTSNTTLSVA